MFLYDFNFCLLSLFLNFFLYHSNRYEREILVLKEINDGNQILIDILQIDNDEYKNKLLELNKQNSEANEHLTILKDQLAALNESMKEKELDANAKHVELLGKLILEKKSKNSRESYIKNYQLESRYLAKQILNKLKSLDVSTSEKRMRKIARKIEKLTKSFMRRAASIELKEESKEDDDDDVITID